MLSLHQSLNSYESGCDNIDCKNLNVDAIQNIAKDVDVLVQIVVLLLTLQIAVLGISRSYEGEGHDRHDLELPGQQVDYSLFSSDDQNELVRTALATGKPVIVYIYVQNLTLFLFSRLLVL